MFTTKEIVVNHTYIQSYYKKMLFIMTQQTRKTIVTGETYGKHGRIIS